MKQKVESWLIMGSPNMEALGRHIWLWAVEKVLKLLLQTASNSAPMACGCDSIQTNLAFNFKAGYIL